MSAMPFNELEQVYDMLAEAIDAAGPGREAEMLTKLCMLLAHRLGDIERVRECVAIAAAPVPEPSGR